MMSSMPSLKPLTINSMIEIKSFVFNTFSVNTYVLSDKYSSKCIIIDPGCHTSEEKKLVTSYIEKNKYKPEYIINTHNHVDHILGNNALKEEYNIPIKCHKEDLYLINNAVEYANLFGFKMEQPFQPDIFLEENDTIKIGQSSLHIVHVPGHSPGSIALINHEQKFIITGDVLFQGSIGRTDLPGGNYEIILNSIKSKLLPIGDTYTIYPGHGDKSTIGVEKKSNPFLNGFGQPRN